MPNELYLARDFTPPGSFTDGAEGPGVDRQGNLYAVNYARQHTIGQVTPSGEHRVFLELPNGSCGNGIRFDQAGNMLIADYTNHNVLRVDMQRCAQAQTLAERNQAISAYAHEPTMNQPNDLAIMANDIIFASDPNWPGKWGQLWRVDTAGKVTLVETGMGTTNGIEVSPDEHTFYVNETVQRTVWAYDLAPNGELSNKRLLIQFPDYGLDGMRCDVLGNLYITRWGKGVIAQVAPTGELLREIALAGAKCTNVAFGGADGCTVYVTGADRGNVESFRVEHPGREWRLAQRQ